jgi:hypothetical protein
MGLDNPSLYLAIDLIPTNVSTDIARDDIFVIG